MALLPHKTSSAPLLHGAAQVQAAWPSWPLAFAMLRHHKNCVEAVYAAGAASRRDNADEPDDH